MDTSRVRSMLLSLPALLQLVAAGSPPRPDTMPRGCPSHCQCDLDGRMLLRVDCSDLGLSELPSNLSVFTSYLFTLQEIRPTEKLKQDVDNDHVQSLIHLIGQQSEAERV
ncbi:hypothetical protein STEG23_036802 [Scotinomys teguina]